MNAEIKLLDQTLSLIHIPLGLYSQFLQPILRLLLPSPCAKLEDEFGELTLAQEHGFLNISVTPIECSIACNETWSRTVFEPIIKQLPKNSAKTVSISAESYCVFRVSSPGADAGSRVVDLTSPLALAGISIFFITTYYSDFLIVPTRSRQNVVQALFEQGFECSEDSSSSFVSPVASSHARGLSQDSDDPPSTPPPSNAAELQLRTFKLLKKHNVVAHTEPNLRLIYCSGKDVSQLETYSRPSRSYAGNGSHRKSSWFDKVDTKFYTSLVAALVSQPRFLSVTLAEEDEPSLLIDRCLLDTFGDSLIGPTDADLTPILLDLVDLPFGATGIVAGVAGKLVEGMRMENAELSYLSTAKTGAVMLSSEYADRALEILSPLLLPKEV